MSPLDTLLNSQPFVVLDGGLATELEARGANLNHALWSAKLLTEDPELIYQVHLDYFLAGADIATTASYQASFHGLRNHGYNETKACWVVKLSVGLAVRARAEATKRQPHRQMLVAGSVGPYGAYLANGAEYRGNYTLPKDAFKYFHRPRIQALVDAGVDILALETMPSFDEIVALVELLREFPSMSAWVSCTVRDCHNLSDGTPLEKVAQALVGNRQIVAMGVNCIPEGDVTDTLKELRRHTDMNLLAYPNSGEVWNAGTKTWSGARNQGERLRESVAQWRGAGARLIGGCCRLGVADIGIIRSCLEDEGAKSQSGPTE